MASFFVNRDLQRYLPMKIGKWVNQIVLASGNQGGCFMSVCGMTMSYNVIPGQTFKTNARGSELVTKECNYTCISLKGGVTPYKLKYGHILFIFML